MPAARCLHRFSLFRLLGAALLLAAAAAAQAQQKGPLLKAGEILKSGEELISSSGRSTASFSPEGNFIVYLRGNPIWSTGTGRRAGAPYQAALSADGSFTIAGTGANGVAVALFNSKSGGKPAGNYFLLLGDDGFLTLHIGTNPGQPAGALWRSGTTVAGSLAAPLSTQFPVLSAAQRAQLSPAQLAAYDADPVVLKARADAAAAQKAAAEAAAKKAIDDAAANKAAATAAAAQKVAADAAAAKKAAEAAAGANVLADRNARYAEQQETARGIAKANAEKEAAAAAAFRLAQAKDKAEAEAMQKKRVDDAAAKAKTDAAYVLANTYRHSGEALAAGQELMSLDLARNHYALMQDDGNLVIYTLGNGKTPEERRRAQKQAWSSGTGGKPRGAYKAVMQNDGNLVVYAPNNSVVWNSGTGGKPTGNYYVRLGATGSLLISMGLDTSRSYIPLWTSATGVIPDPPPIQRFPPTPEQRGWLSPAQIAWATAWAPTAEQHAELVRLQKEVHALHMAKMEEAANLARWKANTAHFEKTRGVYCPEQLSDDRVAGQGRGDREPMTVRTKRLGDSNLTTTIRTRNCLPVAVWITIHDVTKTFVKDGGCVPPHKLKDWQGGNLMAGIYYVRAEILKSTDCLSPAVDSTRIQANVGFEYLGAGMSFDILMDVKNKSYYWEHPVKVGKGTVSAAGKMFTDLGEETGITDAVKKAWNLMTGNCAVVAQYMPNILTPVMKVAEAYGPPALQTGAQCYEQSLESFYCQFPAELGRIVSGGGSNASTLPKLAEQLWNEAKTEECRYFIALTPVMPGAPMFCAMSKLVVTDAKKAVQCAMAAERTGAVKELLAGAHSFPSEETCRGMGEVAFKVAMKVATGGKNKAGGSTLKATVDEFKTIYKAAGAGAAALDRFEKKLASMPACRD